MKNIEISADKIVAPPLRYAWLEPFGLFLKVYSTLLVILSGAKVLRT